MKKSFLAAAHENAPREPEEEDQGSTQGAESKREERAYLTTPNKRDVVAQPRQTMEQAASDIKRGLRDTERRGIPSDVPGPGIPPEETPGGEVPAGGIDRYSHASREEMDDPENTSNEAANSARRKA